MLAHILIDGTFNRDDRTATCSQCGKNTPTTAKGRPGQPITRKCANEISTDRVYMGA